MLASCFVAALLLTPTPTPDKTVPDPTWVGKTVITKLNARMVQLEEGKLVNATLLTGIDYRVLAEKDDLIQIKTQQGATGWLKKTDVILLDDAPVFFSRLIQDNAEDHDSYNRRARCWVLKGELDLAIKDFTESLRISPHAAMYNNRAIVWAAKKNYDKAIEDYSQAIHLQPQFAPPYCNRGSMWLSKKEYDKAIEDCSTAISLDPQFALAYRLRGNTWKAQKEYDRAIDDYTRVLELDPISATTYQDRGQAWVGKKEYGKASDDYNRGLKLSPTLPALCNATAWLLATCPDKKIRDGKRAVHLAKQALGKQKTNANYIDTLAAAYAEIGDFDEAVRWQQKTLGDAHFKKDAAAQRRLELYRKMQPYREE